MKPNRLGKRPLGKATVIFLSGILGAAVAFIAMRLWLCDFRYLLIGSSGDSALELMGIRNMIETGTRNESIRLGGITGQMLFDYPVSDFLNYAIMRVIALFTDNAATVMNVFYFLCFPLSAMTATGALLSLDVSRAVALCMGVLYPFLPYHFLRNQNHLLLSAYYAVPLAILVALWLITRKSEPHFSRKDRFRVTVSRNRYFFLSVLFCLVLSSTGLYYAFFACYFLFLAVLYLAFSDKKISRSVRTGGVYILTVVGGVVLNYLPTLLYHLSGGERAAALSRPGESAEIYGLKIIDLLMPTVGHRNAEVEAFVNAFHATVPVSNENITVSLGILGSVGFLILLAAPILRFRNTLSDRGATLKHTSYFLYGGVFLAMQGGFGAIVCRLFIHGIRAYNRIVVFLFFLALIAVSLLLDVVFYGAEKTWITSNNRADEIRNANNKHGKRSGVRSFCARNRRFLAILLVPITLFALYDMVPRISEQDYAANIAADVKRQQFYAAAEASVPRDTRVFMLPYTDFPEPYTSYGSSPYAQLEAYLNTKTLRFSYGAMAGTSSAEWAKATAQMDAQKMLRELLDKGYGAVCIDLYRYPDNSLQTLADRLAELTGQTPILSSDGQQIFLPLGSITQEEIKVSDGFDG